MGLLSPNINSLLITLLPLLSPARATAADQTTSATLPLTTIFTPPPNCFTDVSLFTGYNYPTAFNSPYSVGLGAGNEFSECSPCWLGLATTSTCFPSSYSISATYSPGVCPEGYEVACSSVNSNGQIFETIATCCPSGYACAPTDRIDQFPWYASQPCSYYPDATLSIVALSIAPTTTITTLFPPTMAPGFAILANSVQIRWQSTDTPTPGVSDNSLPSATGHKLSGAAIGGIVIGAFFGVVILIRCYFFRPRRRVNGKLTGERGRSIKDMVEGRFSRPEQVGMVQTAPENDTTQGIFSKAELEGTIQNRPRVNKTRGLFSKAELGDTQVSELGGVDIPEV